MVRIAAIAAVALSLSSSAVATPSTDGILQQARSFTSNGRMAVSRAASLGKRQLEAFFIIQLQAGFDFFGPGKNETALRFPLLKNQTQIPSTIRNFNLSEIVGFAGISECFLKYGIKSCGTGGCRNIPKDTKLLKEYGNDRATPGIYVAVTPSRKQITIGHTGSNFSDPTSYARTANQTVVPFNYALIKPKNAPRNMTIHSGIQQFWTDLGPTLQQEIPGIVSQYPGYSILFTGQSFGSAIALLNVMSLKPLLPSNTKISAVVFGLPRTGNQQFADYVDQVLGNNFAHIAKDDDPVPHLPNRSAGFRQPSNEIFFDKGTYYWCQGQENAKCIDSRFGGNFPDHRGPHFGVALSTQSCTAETLS